MRIPRVSDWTRWLSFKATILAASILVLWISISYLVREPHNEVIRWTFLSALGVANGLAASILLNLRWMLGWACNCSECQCSCDPCWGRYFGE